MSRRDNSAIWKRPIESRRRPTTFAGGLRFVVDEALEALALPVALFEYYAHCFLDVFAAGHPENDPYLRPWKLVKDSLVLLLLVAAYLQYYLLGVMVEIASLPVIPVYL